MRFRPQVLILGLASIGLAVYAISQGEAPIANTIAGGIVAILTFLARKG